MPEIRPRLKYLGSFGLRRTITFSELVIKMGLRRQVVVQTDDERGAMSWQLIYKKLPGTLDDAVSLTGDEFAGAIPDEVISRAEYLWEFYCARKRGPVQSFIIEDLLDRRRRNYLVVFRDSSLSYEMFMVQLFSADGVALDQVDEPDVATLEDGSLGEASANTGAVI